MYINKEDYDIYFNGELIGEVIDIDTQEVSRLGCEGIGECLDVLTVTFLGPGGKLRKAIDSAEKFSFKRKLE